MAIDIRHDIKLLNGLYSALLDNATTYGEAAGATPDAGHADFYRTREAQRRGLAGGLSTEIEARGGEATHGEGLLATARKVVKDVKLALGRDEAATLSGIEHDETALLARFDRALEDTDMSATTRETIRRARGEVARGKPQAERINASEHTRKRH